jgi:hypothetical protein
LDVQKFNCPACQQTQKLALSPEAVAAIRSSLSQLQHTSAVKLRQAQQDQQRDSSGGSLNQQQQQRGHVLLLQKHLLNQQQQQGTFDSYKRKQVCAAWLCPADTCTPVSEDHHPLFLLFPAGTCVMHDAVLMVAVATTGRSFLLL